MNLVAGESDRKEMPPLAPGGGLINF